MLNKQTYSKPREFIKLKTDPIINEYYNPNDGPGSEIKFETKYKNLVEKTMLKRVRNKTEVRKLKESETITFDYYQTKDDKSENLLISIISRVSPNEGNQSIKSVCIGPKNDPKEETECSNAITNHINQRWAQRQALINRLKALKPPSTDMDWVVRKKTNQDMEMNKLEMKRNIHKAQQQQEQQKLNEQQQQFKLPQQPVQQSLYQSQQNDKDVSIKICLDDFNPVRSKSAASYKNIFELESEFGEDRSEEDERKSIKAVKQVVKSEEPVKEMNKLTIRDKKAEIKNIFETKAPADSSSSSTSSPSPTSTPSSVSESENQVVPEIKENQSVEAPKVEEVVPVAEPESKPDVEVVESQVEVVPVEQAAEPEPEQAEPSPVEPAVEQSASEPVVVSAEPEPIKEVAKPVEIESTFDQTDFSKTLEFKPSASLFSNNNNNNAGYNYNYNPLKNDYPSFSPSAFTPPALHQQQSNNFSLFKNTNNNYDYANNSYLGLSMPNVAPINNKSLNKPKKQQNKNKKPIVRSSSQNSSTSAYMVPPYGSFMASDHQLMPNDRSNLYMAPPAMSYNSVGSTNTTSSQPIDNSFQSLTENPYLIPAMPSMDMGIYRVQNLYDTGYASQSSLQATAPPFMSQQQSALTGSQQSPVNYNPYQTPIQPLGANNKRAPKQRFESPLNTNNADFGAGKAFNRGQKYQPPYLNNSNNNFNSSPSAPVLNVQPPAFTPQSNLKHAQQPFSSNNFVVDNKKTFEPVGTFTDSSKSAKKFNKATASTDEVVKSKDAEPTKSELSSEPRSQLTASNKVDGEIVIENNSDNDHELSALFESLTNPAYNLTQKPKAIVLHAPKQMRKKFIEQAIAEGKSNKVKINNFSLPPFGPSLILNPQPNFLTTSSNASYYLSANLPQNLTSLLPALLNAASTVPHMDESGDCCCDVNCSGLNENQQAKSSDQASAAKNVNEESAAEKTDGEATNESKVKPANGKNKVWPKAQNKTKTKTSSGSENGNLSSGEQTQDESKAAQKPKLNTKAKPAGFDKEKAAKSTKPAGQKTNKTKQPVAKTEEEAATARKAPSPVLTDAMFPMTLPIKTDFNSPFLFDTRAAKAEPAESTEGAESIWSKRVLWSQIVSNRKLSGGGGGEGLSDNENLTKSANDITKEEEPASEQPKKSKSSKKQQQQQQQAVAAEP